MKALNLILLLLFLRILCSAEASRLPPFAFLRFGIALTYAGIAVRGLQKSATISILRGSRAVLNQVYGVDLHLEGRVVSESKIFIVDFLGGVLWVLKILEALVFFEFLFEFIVVLRGHEVLVLRQERPAPLLA